MKIILQPMTFIRRMLFLQLVFVLSASVLSACTGDLTRDTIPVIFESPSNERVRIFVEIADEPQERAHGLMGRTELAENKGMLFIFDKQDTLSFWMKNTLIPLDIIYFTSVGEFVSSRRMQPCTDDPCLLYSSGGPARYAIEVPAGFVRRYGVGEGWRLRMR